MPLMAVTPAWACDGICPMGKAAKTEVASPCPGHQTEATPTCDGLMLLSDCVDLTITKADVAAPKSVVLSWHPAGDSAPDAAFMPESTFQSLTKVRAPPKLAADVPDFTTPLLQKTRRLRL